ncbi:MAG: bifunctional phosphoribosylaminoimidazolecarboxamide formyltransferase/IMP cyclohydrolase [Thermoplasmatales archaeon]|nr:bifunctional phosphoribosylaminoimidazolecarboxamide formyltransferase/IMP cyclohydrolase [Candidatus Thermoplasmatota archaeon]MDA8056101.1 bifunctional phosphoribosylaminoimidazolecarboxamide formyltransferase/IMP cyclohydrolase [Thermoplasmatales archaeon]
MRTEEGRNAIISVSNKEGLERIGSFLSSNKFKIFGTSGTRSYLESHGISCESVEKLTGNPEILGGRVKTLSASLLAGLLAKDRNDGDLEKFGYLPIDLVYVELYDFLGSFLKGAEDLVEFIDIGGVTMLRAAAKNYQRVVVVPGRASMDNVMSTMKDGEIPSELRRSLAGETFRLTSYYDYAISQWLDGLGEIFVTGGREYERLRYGENPHQSAHSYAMYPPFFEILKKGKEVSFNNIIDAWAAWELVLRLERGSSSVVKHASPCGAATGSHSIERAYDTDSVSAYGGILAYNGLVNSEHASFLKDKFLEVIIARDYEREAYERLDKKKNLRLLKGRDDVYSVPDVRSAGNIILVQEWNKRSDLSYEIRSGSPDEVLLKDMLFGWEVAKSIKSNAVAIVKDGWLLSSGGGQPNRVDSVRLALNKAKDSGRIGPSAVLVSDGFFPFADSLELIDDYGIKNIAAPMGSIRDAEVIDYANKKLLTFIEVKERAFRH